MRYAYVYVYMLLLFYIMWFNAYLSFAIGLCLNAYVYTVHVHCQSIQPKYKYVYLKLDDVQWWDCLKSKRITKRTVNCRIRKVKNSNWFMCWVHEYYTYITITCSTKNMNFVQFYNFRNSKILIQRKLLFPMK